MSDSYFYNHNNNNFIVPLQQINNTYVWCGCWDTDTGGLVGGTIGGAIGGRAYEIGKNISNVTKKTFKGFRKTPYNKTTEYKKLFKDNNKGETKLRIAS